MNVISKSGGTAETMAQYLVVRAWLEDALGAAALRVTSCSPPIRSGARCASSPRREGIATLERAARVGGRFSVLSPVGLLPAALVGIDIDGAARAARGGRCERAERDDLLQNPAALYAALHWAADTDLGARIHVLMPYTDRLREFAEWYRQLWAESLGKRVDRRGRGGASSGPRRSAAVGATDQHSQVQLFMEGPFDKVDHLRRGWTISAIDVPIPAAAGPPGRPRLPAGSHAGRAAARRVRGHLGGAGADGADELHPAAAGARRRTAWAS